MIRGTAKELVQQLVGKVGDGKTYEVKEVRKKRSLTANSYYWQLLTKIADKLRTSKEELHIQMLKEYGQITAVCVPENFSLDGYIKYYEQDGVIYRGGKKFITHKVYKPSSEMNSKEMSILIDGVVSEAKELDIETLPRHEINMMLEALCIKERKQQESAKKPQTG